MRGTQVSLSKLRLSSGNGATHLLVFLHVTTSLGVNEGDITTKVEGFLLSCAVCSCPVQSRNQGHRLQTDESTTTLNKRATAFNQRVQEPVSDPPWYQRDFTLSSTSRACGLTAGCKHGKINTSHDTDTYGRRGEGDTT